MIKHIVMWNLKEENKQQNEIEIKTRLEGLKDVIPEIITLEVGKNFNPSDGAYDLALYSEFASKEDLNRYVNHPAHKAIAEFIATVRTGRIVADYEI